MRFLPHANWWTEQAAQFHSALLVVSKFHGHVLQFGGIRGGTEKLESELSGWIIIIGRHLWTTWTLKNMRSTWSTAEGSSCLKPSLLSAPRCLPPPTPQSPSRSSSSSSSEWWLSELDVLLLAGTIAHTLSLAASSFVEEEHQTWYFLLSTLCLAVFQDVCRKYFRERRVSGDYDGEEEDSLLPSKDSSRPFAHLKGEGHSEKWLALATPIFTLVCCRLLRSLNQTGVQWAHLPDVGHWLNRWVSLYYQFLTFPLAVTIVVSRLLVPCFIVHKHNLKQ